MSFIGMNGYYNGAKRCWCHWIKFESENDLYKWHEKNPKETHKVKMRDIHGNISYFEI